MEGQSKLMSGMEAVVNVAVGFSVAVATQVTIFPYFEIDVPMTANLQIGLVFTIVSLIRSYVLRRVFNQMHECSTSEVSLSVCPGCGGYADNGHDRSYPPSPYYCSKCDSL